MITENTTLQDLLEMAKRTTSEVATDEIFVVKDLFRGFEWNRIWKGNRTKLGSLHFAYAQNEGNALIKPVGKTPQNQQKYQKL